MNSEFKKAMTRWPVPITCFSDGVVCPWCGSLIKTITFGENGCDECLRWFCFGYPDWYSGKDPISHVPFPHAAFEATGGIADNLYDWKPNDRLKEHYHTKGEESFGSFGDPAKPN